VIEAFGHFLIGGNFAVGLIVFAILVVINFVVVTKGAERIAEVGARFTLDAMPGKQMAIDADLNAGLIDEKEAKRRRAEVGEEADFFGSMDGASKFVRGDAIAGILILFINIVGGFIIGMASTACRPARRPRLHPAGRGRRAGGADPGAADLGGRGDGGVARGQGAGHRQRRSAARCSSSPQGAGPSRRASSALLGLIPACRTWCSWLIAGAAGLAGLAGWRSASAAARLHPSQRPGRAARPAPRPAGTTCSRWTRWAWRSATG
jgi:hypothetical protein